jgi:LmbE family N-acetylglucosaminyl deacetylase
VTAPLPPALFVAAHPDDEVLGMCVAIAEHVAAGQDVHLLWLTDGPGSGARGLINGSGTASWWGVPHDPAAEGYASLDAAEFAAARIREGTNAIRLLATGYPGTLTIHRAGLADGVITTAQAQAEIVAVADAINPGGPVRVKTHTWLVDNHSDHIAAGTAAKALAANNPARFSVPRYYILPAYWADARLAQVGESFDTPSNTGVAARCRNACRAYAAWSPPETFAVGYHSVPGYFASIDANPRSMVHA